MYIIIVGTFKVLARRAGAVAWIGPADYNAEETVSTLRYASRAKAIENKPRINEDPKDAMIREFHDEITRLRSELEKFGGANLM